MPTIAEKARLEAEQAELENPDDAPAEPAAPAEADDETAEEEETPAEPEGKKGKRKSPTEEFEAMIGGWRREFAAFAKVKVGEVVTAPHAGVIGFMVPGFAEP